MKINLAICDDDNNQIEFTKNLVNTWAINNNILTDIKTYNSAEDFLFNAIDESFDIALLDIEMGKINGVELAYKIRMQDEMVQIIFITGYDDYIAQGYEVSALQYLMKPIKKEKFLQTLDRAIEKLKRNEKKLFCKTNNGNINIPLFEIKYIEVNKNYITVFAKEEYIMKMTLSNIEKELDSSFFKIGRSFIINLAFIKKVLKSEVVLIDESVIPLPRGMYEKLNRAIINS